MPMTGRDRVTRAIEFRKPDRIPARITCLPALWHTYRDDLRRLTEKYDWMNDFGPRLPGKGPSPDSYDSFDDAFREGEEYTDNWGTVWHNAYGGLFGQAKGFPLEDWSALPSFKAPDPTV
jgi:hypothetical protein